MTTSHDPREAARFLRTLRVAAQTALALEDMRSGRQSARPAATFLALAAKGVDDWRFPAEGVLSADGLMRASVTREGAAASTLVMQALGASGLATFAGRGARVRLGSSTILEGAFDRNGLMSLALGRQSVDETDLSRLEVDVVETPE